MIENFNFLDDVVDKKESLTISTPESQEVNEFVKAVTHPRYICRLGEIIARLNPRRYLAIGGLFGTTEAYAMQCCGWTPESITIIDLDCEEYNPDRDSGAYLYRNICGTKYSGFNGEFRYCRVDSQKILKGRFAECVPIYDLIFVDAKHTSEAVKKDIENAVWSLDAKGCILVHDIELEGSTVRAGYDEWIANHPYWKHIELSHDNVLHGLGIIWR